MNRARGPPGRRYRRDRTLNHYFKEENVMEVFRKYPETTPAEERKGSPVCIVSHPDAGGPCRREAIGEVWSLPFCAAHGREAELVGHLSLA